MLPGVVNVNTHLPSLFVRGVYGVVTEGLFKIGVYEYLPDQGSEMLDRGVRFIKNREGTVISKPS